MFERISSILNKKIKKTSFLKKSLFIGEIKKYLEKNSLKDIDFKVTNKKEIAFYCPDHTTIDFLKHKEEDLKDYLKDSSFSFRYFLKK